MKQKKKIIFTNNSDIRLGFELECVITSARIYNQRRGGYTRSSKWRRFCYTIHNIQKGINIGEDGSINTYNAGGFARGVELRTLPLPPKDAMILLEKLFEVINEFGFTNNSCGLHVNISSKNKENMKKFNPLPFLHSKIWNQILSKFGRKNNGYCRPVVNNKKGRTNVDVLKTLSVSTNKYRCVTLSNFGSGLNKTSRIEIRGFGNSIYTRKFNLVSKYVKKIMKLFKLSCNQPIFIPIHV